MSRIRVPRWLQVLGRSSYELHRFADASQRAYAAAVFLRGKTGDGRCTTTLLIAKTKVTPVRTVSIPRLELCGAMLLVRLLCQVLDALRVGRDFPTLTAWSDSRTVLAWIKGHPSKWSVFVSNRVSEIQSSLPSLQWRHVPSANNPADLVTRGVGLEEMTKDRLWFQGPVWLSEEPHGHTVRTTRMKVRWNMRGALRPPVGRQGRRRKRFSVDFHAGHDA